MKQVPNYLFHLGQNQALSRAEIEAMLPQAELELLPPHFLKVSGEFDVQELGSRLGGTTKIAELVATTEPDELENKLVELIAAKFNKNFSLLLLNLPKAESYTLAAEVKKTLTAKDIKARFVAGDTTGLSPLVITKQSVLEYIITENGDIYETVWVHSFKNWIIRDRKKPFITPKTGMLPPKLARIMVNLGIANKDPKAVTLLDPFCGTGTVLMEASLLGSKVIGSDLSGEKIQGTTKNLEWLPKDQTNIPMQTPRLLVADATTLSTYLKDNVDVVVTEPTLGPPSPKEKNLHNLARGLQKLYLGMLKDWRSFLAPGARLVIAFPLFHGQKHDYPTSTFIDARENLGYNVIRKDLIFTRPGAQIERQIIILERI